MFAYRIRPGFARYQYAGTLREARELARDCVNNVIDYGDVKVDLVEVKTDRETILSLLGGWGCDEKVHCSWQLTKRGALVKTETK